MEITNIIINDYNYLPVTTNAETATVTVTTTNNNGESYVVFVGRTGGIGDPAGVQIFLVTTKTEPPVSKRNDSAQYSRPCTTTIEVETGQEPTSCFTP